MMVGTLIDMVDKLKIGETGYGVIYDKAGKYVAHTIKDILDEMRLKKNIIKK